MSIHITGIYGVYLTRYMMRTNISFIKSFSHAYIDFHLRFFSRFTKKKKNKKGKNKFIC